MKGSILTLGCKVNQSESSIIEGSLINIGYSIVGLDDHPDFCIVNTCTVTAKSDYQSRQLIRRAIKSGAKVIVTGCYAHLRPEEIIKIGDNISIVNNNKKLSIIDMLASKTISYTLNYSSRSRPYLKVQDGCNFTCAYCTVPLARGKPISINIHDVIRQAIDLEASGYNEIVLTGIHLGLYGYELIPKVNLSDLIKSILSKTKIKRIRLSSLELNEVDEEIIELLQEERICKHIHIPLQSGDNKILKLMKRRYNAEDYASIIERIKNKIPSISIGTDIIVGFPGEDEKEFTNTKVFIESLPLTYMHLFPFSPRPNTLALKMPDHVPHKIKRERVAELNALNIKKQRTYLSLQVNKSLDIIIEKKDDKNITLGTSSNYLKVMIPSNRYVKGELIRVRIAGIEKNMLKGYPI
ncbi:MAG: tRNA (N(6)-L-threonylcarbamoyladenosine(37)-C(2))-methylthiotransferase MtaB [Nitrospirota bacterium]